MTDKFNFNSLNNHDLYHIRYGRGAVIVAIKKSDSAQQKPSSTHIAQLFASREQNLNDFTRPKLDPVNTI